MPDPSHFPADYGEGRRRFLAACENRGARPLEPRDRRPRPGRRRARRRRRVPRSRVARARPRREFRRPTARRDFAGERAPAPAPAGAARRESRLPRRPGAAARARGESVRLRVAPPRQREQCRPESETSSATPTSTSRTPTTTRSTTPSTPNSSTRRRTRRAGRGSSPMRRGGLPRLQAVLTRGQYAHPRGVQFGGAREESRTTACGRSCGARRAAPGTSAGSTSTPVWASGEVEMISEFEPGARA